MSCSACFVLPFGDMSNIYHIDLDYYIGKLLFASIIGPLRFILVFAAIMSFMLTLSRYLANLFKDPTIPVGVGCWFILSAMDSAWSVQEFAKLARSIFVPLKGFLFCPDLGLVNPALTVVSSMSLPPFLCVRLFLLR